MKKPVDKKKFLMWMRKEAKIIERPIDAWPEDFDTQGTAYLLRWAAQIISKHAPDEMPEMKLYKRKGETT